MTPRELFTTPVFVTVGIGAIAYGLITLILKKEKGAKEIRGLIIYAILLLLVLYSLDYERYLEWLDSLWPF